MSTSLSKFVKYLSEKLHSDKCTDTDCKSHLDFISNKGDQLIFRCFECKKNYKKYFNKESKNWNDYHDLYVQRDTLLLADVFENFRNEFIGIYELDLVHFLFAPGLAWQAALKKSRVKLELLTNIDMLLMAEKGIRGGTVHAIHKYAKANYKYMKNYDKNVISSYLMYLDANNFYWWAMSQNCL